MTKTCEAKNIVWSYGYITSMTPCTSEAEVEGRLCPKHQHEVNEFESENDL